MYPAAAQQRHWTDSPTKVLGLISAALGVVTAALTLATQLGAFGNLRIPFLPGAAKEPSISLSVGQGSSGRTVTVSGSDFASEETVTIRFHTEQIGTARTGESGSFTQEVRIPGTFDAFAPQQFDIVVSGGSSARTATAPFRLLPGGSGPDSSGPAKISLSRGSGPSGTDVTVTGENFAGGEEVLIRFHTDAVGSAIADEDGRFSVTITIPGSFDVFGQKQYDIVATGQTSVKPARRAFLLTV